MFLNHWSSFSYKIMDREISILDQFKIGLYKLFERSKAFGTILCIFFCRNILI